jgi:hypothetical protein
MIDGRLEIGGLVTFRTSNRFVLSFKGKTRSPMIKIESQSCLTPAGYGMTAPTGCDECPVRSAWQGVQSEKAMPLICVSEGYRWGDDTCRGDGLMNRSENLMESWLNCAAVSTSRGVTSW